ncbi:MAG TPA: response regulator [Candidatus Saccharimonadales bacterium]|nr:response regulator [Candidatus Saccharimonadales bacterium]
MPRILLVEDEAILRESFSIIMSAQSYIFETATNGKTALDKCRENNYDLILLDLMMPIMDGVEFLENFIEKAPVKTKVVVMSNLSSSDLLKKAEKLGIHKSVLKSDMSPKQLLSLINREVGPAKAS